MMRRIFVLAGFTLSVAFVHAACSGSATQPTPSSTTTPTPAPVTPAAPKPTLAAPVAVSPANGSTVNARPTMTVTNAARTGTLTGSVIYRFDISESSAFTPVNVSGEVPEGSSQTSFTMATDLVAGRTYFWRVTASSSADGLTTAPSDTQSFVIVVPTTAERIATQQGVVLWPGAKPTGGAGLARMGPGWGVGVVTSYDGVNFQSPPIEALRLFDLMDRGLSPDAAIGWMRVNGYPSVAVYYDSVKSIGLPYQYMALIAGAWELVRRVGA